MHDGKLTELRDLSTTGDCLMRRIVLIASLLFVFPISFAEAAPQILGLFATGPTPTQLHCKDGVCSARFSAFCLQQQRDAPLSGQAYVPAEGTELRLIVTDRDGYQRMVPADGVTIRSASHYTSVSISIAEDTVRALGGETVALVVPARATLLPESLSTDPNPQTVAEIEQAVGQHRRIGENMVERGGKLSEAAQAAMAMINRLRGNPDPLPKAAQTAVAKRVLKQTSVSQPAQDMMANRVQLCENLNQSVWYKGGMSTCLQSYHDSFVSTLNVDFWNALGTGS